MAYLLAYLLAVAGLTIVIVWPETGPSAWLRESLLRRLLPSKAAEMLDCYICLSFWTGLIVSPAWWWMYREPWCWFGCLMMPPIFWLVLQHNSQHASREGEDDRA